MQCYDLVYREESAWCIGFFKTKLKATFPFNPTPIAKGMIFVYNYECFLFEEGKLETRKKSGVIGITTLSGQYEYFVAHYARTSTEKLAPKLTVGEALRKAKGAVIHENTKVVEGCRREYCGI